MGEEAHQRLTTLIIDWCEAQNVWDTDIKGTKTPPTQVSGLPKILTREDLYYAGRALYDIAKIKPVPSSVYADNNYITKRTPDEKTKTDTRT